jgi:hypothetical protein
LKNTKTLRRPVQATLGGRAAAPKIRKPKMAPGAILGALAPGACILLILAACASVPKAPEFPLDGPLPLDGGALVYLVTDVSLARSFLDMFSIEGLGKAETAQVLDLTRYAAAAVFPPDSGRRFQAAAWGNYPSFRARLALTGDRGWKRGRAAAGSFWYSAERNAALAFNGTQAFAVLGTTGTGAANPVPAPAAGPYAQGPGVPVPQGFSAFREGACLALWIENPADPLGRFLEGLRLPIRIPAEELLAALVPLDPPEESGPLEAPRTRPQPGTPEPQAAGPGFAGALYEIRLRIKTPTEANARTLMTLFSTARLFLPQAARTAPETFELLSLLFARPPVQEGAYLTVRTAPVNEGDIALLFNLFSVYSREN